VGRGLLDIAMCALSEGSVPQPLHKIHIAAEISVALRAQTKVRFLAGGERLHNAEVKEEIDERESATSF
jgi:hypothetical protein